MPLYDYQCTDCQKNWEIQQSIKDQPIKECPYCHNPTAQRLISQGSGVIFKGSGFYQTDYKNKETS